MFLGFDESELWLHGEVITSDPVTIGTMVTLASVLLCVGCWLRLAGLIGVRGIPPPLGPEQRLFKSH